MEKQNQYNLLARSKGFCMHYFLVAKDNQAYKGEHKGAECTPAKWTLLLQRYYCVFYENNDIVLSVLCSGCVSLL